MKRLEIIYLGVTLELLGEMGSIGGFRTKKKLSKEEHEAIMKYLKCEGYMDDLDVDKSS